MEKKILYAKGMFALCPVCDRDALEITETVYSGEKLRSDNSRAIAPTALTMGGPIISGCCEEPLLGGPSGRREFLAMRTGAGFTKV